MGCYSPLQAWRQWGSLAAGEPRIVFSKHQVEAKPLELPCGQCIGCRLERSRIWAVRIMHEAQLHTANSFLTLTYDDSHVPSDGSLKKEDFQLFMKRLRKASSVPLRYFHCGEYGEQFSRPHYHACLFGEDFSSDRVEHSSNPQGDKIYVSRRLSEVWGLGFALIGDVSFESAAYVARYCLKKADLAGKAGKDLEARKNAYKNWLQGRAPEYVTMSRMPGIGAEWFAKFGKEVYPSDSVVMRGREMMPPPFYDKILEKIDPDLFKRVKREREDAGKKLADSEDMRSRRLLDRRICKEQTIKATLKRSI